MFFFSLSLFIWFQRSHSFHMCVLHNAIHGAVQDWDAVQRTTIQLHTQQKWKKNETLFNQQQHNLQLLLTRERREAKNTLLTHFFFINCDDEKLYNQSFHSILRSRGERKKNYFYKTDDYSWCINCLWEAICLPCNKTKSFRSNNCTFYKHFPAQY